MTTSGHVISISIGFAWWRLLPGIGARRELRRLSMV
jgi:hypothetical protein